MAITPRIPDAPCTHQSPAVVLSAIEGLLLDLSLPHNFNQYTDFRKSVRVLSSLLPPIQRAAEGFPVSPPHQRFVRTELEGVRQQLAGILDSILFYRLALYWTPLRPLWLRVYMNTSAGQRTLSCMSQISLQVIHLNHSDSMKTLTRVPSLETLVDTPSPPSAAPLISPNAGLYASQSSPRRIKLSQVSKDDRVIFVMGATGAGKSTFINVAAGQQIAEVSDSLDACTRKVQAYRVQDHQHRPVVLIDTPGFDENSTHDAEILTSISSSLNDMHKRHISPCGLLYLHNMSLNRVNKYQLTLLHKMCGQDAQGNLIIVPTMGEFIGAPLRDSRLADVTRYWQSIIHDPSSILPFDNTQTSAWSIIDELNNPRPLQITLQMNHEKKRLGDTSVGEFLLAWLEMIATKIREQLARVASHWRRLSSMDGAEETLRNNLKAVAAQIDLLKGSMGRKPANKSGMPTIIDPHHYPRMDSGVATTYRLIFISQLTSQLEHLTNLEKHVPTPCLAGGLEFFSQVLQTLRYSERLPIPVIRLLQDLYLIFAVALDDALQDLLPERLERVWGHISSTLASSISSIQEIASSGSSGNAPPLGAYKHLAACQQIVGYAYDILELPKAYSPDPRELDCSTHN